MARKDEQAGFMKIMASSCLKDSGPTGAKASDLSPCPQASRPLQRPGYPKLHDNSMPMFYCEKGLAKLIAMASSCLLIAQVRWGRTEVPTSWGHQKGAQTLRSLLETSVHTLQRHEARTSWNWLLNLWQGPLDST